MNAYNKLMYDFYQVLNNAWTDSVKEASKSAIRMLIATKETSNITSTVLDDLMETIKVELGEEFAALVRKDTKTYIEKSYQYGLNDVQREMPGSIGIGLYGVKDKNISSVFAKQQHFWIGEHFNADISEKFAASLYTAIDRGFTIKQLTDQLSSQFKDISQKGRPYWQGLAEHTSLRIREFGRLGGYEKAGARGYILVNPMDDRTSDICWALVSKGEVYPLDEALEIRDRLLEIEMKPDNLENARERIKALAPWVKERDIIRDEGGDPIGVSGAHTPFPPFHWKCRTETQIVM